MPQVFRKKPADDSGPSVDERREQRLDEVKRLVERFMYDLGRLIAGHTIELEEYVAPAAARRLRASVEPFLASGDAMRPNFGEYGELRVEGNLLSYDRPVMAYVEFEDSSVRETASGELLSTPRRRMVLTLTVDPSAEGINDFDLRPASS